MHADKGVPLGILMTDAFARPTADGIHYVKICNSMAYRHAVGILRVVSTYVEKSF